MTSRNERLITAAEAESAVVNALEMAGDYQAFDWEGANSEIDKLRRFAKERSKTIASNAQLLFIGPKGHLYTVDDVRHALMSLREDDVDVDVPLVDQFKLLADSGVAQLMLIASDHARSFSCAPIDRVFVDSLCEACGPEEYGEGPCSECGGVGRVPYEPSQETIDRAIQITLRVLLVTGYQLGDVFEHAVTLLGDDPLHAVQRQSLLISAYLCQVTAELAITATHPDDDSSRVLTKIRRQLTRVLKTIASSLPVVH